MNFNVTIPNWGCWIITICFIIILVIRILKMIPSKIYHKISLRLFYHNSEKYRTDKINERERNGEMLIRKEENERAAQQKKLFSEKVKKMTDDQKHKN